MARALQLLIAVTTNVQPLRTKWSRAPLELFGDELRLVSNTMSGGNHWRPFGAVENGSPFDKTSSSE